MPNERWHFINSAYGHLVSTFYPPFDILALYQRSLQVISESNITVFDDSHIQYPSMMRLMKPIDFFPS